MLGGAAGARHERQRLGPLTKPGVATGAQAYSVAPGAAKIVKLKLTKQGQRLLKRQRTLAVRVSSVYRDAKTGLSRTSSRTIKLKAKKKK